MVSLSATAEMLNTSGPAVSYGNLSIGNNHRNLALAPAVLQHFLHQTGIKLNVVIDMIRIRLTGARGIGSALFSVNNCLAHVVPLNV
jgi:hypothetical protein